jgi:hypothetical protein
VPAYCTRIIAKNCSNEEFFLGFIENIKVEVGKAQNKLKMYTGIQSKEISLSLERLKKDYDVNFDEIFALEEKLKKIGDQELRDSLMDLKIFEHASNEKPTAHFLNLAKKSKQVNRTIRQMIFLMTTVHHSHAVTTKKNM